MTRIPPLEDQEVTTDTFDQVWCALDAAAHAIANNGHGQTVKRGRRVVGFEPTQTHRDVVDMMERFARGDAGPDDAMALLWRSDVWHERFNTAERPWWTR